MKPVRGSVKGLWLATLVFLSACSSMQPVAVDETTRQNLYETKYSRITGLSQWRMTGRLAVSDKKEGGSGHFSWETSRSGSRMGFHGALGRGAWQLVADNSGAELELADGTVRRADTVERLVRLQVGWEIPVNNLAWWVRGLAAPGEVTRQVIDDQGNLTELQQDGWTIDYGNYRDFEGINLPVKLFARQSDWKVKLAIKEWGFEKEGGNIE